MNPADRPRFGTLSGVVVPGDGRGRWLGFPTANLSCPDAVLPEDGIYAAWATLDDGSPRMPASVSIGTNPTFLGERERRVEVHLIGVDPQLNLYARRMGVELVSYLRATLRFANTEELIAQTALDVQRCRSILLDSLKSGG